MPIDLTPAQEKYRARASKRVRVLSDSELVTWSDNIGSGMASALLAYFRDGDEDTLREYVDGAIALQVIALEFFARKGLDI